MLTRLLNNLIGNAYRYGKRNGYILVELSESPEQVILSVKDNGIGISSEDQKHIFQRFYRADKSRASKGTGIGLAMVNEIAELLKVLYLSIVFWEKVAHSRLSFQNLLIK